MLLFCRGCASLGDDSHEGRPTSVEISKNTNTWVNRHEEDWHVNYRDIEAFLDISQTVIHSILHEHLAGKNSSSCFKINRNL